MLNITDTLFWVPAFLLEARFLAEYSHPALSILTFFFWDWTWAIYVLSSAHLPFLVGMLREIPDTITRRGCLVVFVPSAPWILFTMIWSRRTVSFTTTEILFRDLG